MFGAEGELCGRCLLVAAESSLYYNMLFTAAMNIWITRTSNIYGAAMWPLSLLPCYNWRLHYTSLAAGWSVHAARGEQTVASHGQ